MRESFPRTGSRTVHTSDAARDLGAELGAALEAGDLVILDGPLGAGKTTFTQGIARGLGVKGRVTSPTFVIAREHKSLSGGPSLVHADVYRLLDAEGMTADPLGNLDSLDLESELDDAVVVAEWGGGLVENLRQDYLLIKISRAEADTAAADDAAENPSGDVEEPREFAWKYVEF